MAENQVVIDLIIKDAQSKKTLADQKTAIEKINTEIKNVEKGSASYNKLKEAQIDLNKQIFDGATNLKEKRQAYEELESALGGVDRGTDGFERMKQSVGDAKDEIDSLTAEIDVAANDFSNLEAGVQTGELIAASFAVAAGSLELFGVESQKAEEVTAKMTSAISVLMGIQSIANIVRKESLFTQKAVSIQRRINIGLLGKQRIATISQAVATGNATIAQRALNFAMRVNPAMIVVTAVMALVGAYAYFSESTDDATESQEGLNDAMEKGKEISKSLEVEMQKSRDITKKRKELSLEEDRKQQIRDVEQSTNSERGKAEKIKDILIQFEKDKSELQKESRLKEKKELQDFIQDEEKIINDAERNITSEEFYEQGFDIRRKNLQKNKAKLRIITENENEKELLSKEQLEAKIQEIENKSSDEIEKIREDSRKQNLENAKRRVDREINIQEKSDRIKLEKATVYEKQKRAIIQESQNEQKELLKFANEDDLKNLDNAYLDGNITLEKYMSERRAIIEHHHSNENSTITEKEKELSKNIEDIMFKRFFALTYIHEQEIEIERNKTKLQEEWTSRRLKNEEFERILSEDNSLSRFRKEELLIEKRIELQQRYVNKTKELTDEIQESEININTKRTAELLDIDKKHLNELLKLRTDIWMDSETAEEYQKRMESAGLTLDEFLKDRKIKHENDRAVLLEIDEKFSQKHMEIRQKKDDEVIHEQEVLNADIEKLQEIKNQKIIAATQYAQEAQQLANEQITNSINKRYDEEIKRIDELEEKRLEQFDNQQRLREMEQRNASISDYQELIREEEIARERAEIQEKADVERNKAQLEQWESQKLLRIGEIAMNTATAISLVTAQTGVAAPFAIPAIASINAAQAGLVIAEKPPVFEYGGRVGGERHSNGGTLIEAERDETIINRNSSNKFPGLLSTINELGGGVSFAEIKPKEQKLLQNITGSNIDYNLLGKSISDAITEKPLKATVLENQITQSQNNVKKQNNRTSV